MLVELPLEIHVLTHRFIQLRVDRLKAHLCLPQSLSQVVFLVLKLSLLMLQGCLLLLRRSVLLFLLV